jgi:cytochrome c oxidase subunit 2
MTIRASRACSWLVVALACAALTLLAGCDHVPVLSPKSAAAAELARLFWILLALTGVPTLIVFGILFVALRRALAAGRVARRGDDADPPHVERAGSGGESLSAHPSEERLLVGGGIAVFAVLVVMLGFTIAAASTARPRAKPALTVRAVGFQYWWEFGYPGEGVVTANHFAIPVGEPVALRLESADVIHSFWVPALHGKIDMVPGHVNEFWIEAGEPGLYRGQCAEFCGPGHAYMAFDVLALPRQEFDRWIAARARPQARERTPLEERGREVFAAERCNLCHSIGARGPEALVGQAGPDLGDFATRRTLAALALPNTPEALRAFLRDPESAKPGIRMPRTELDDARLDALVAYLRSLDGGGP